jgi:hypothetical protein
MLIGLRARVLPERSCTLGCGGRAHRFARQRDNPRLKEAGSKPNIAQMFKNEKRPSVPSSQSHACASRNSALPWREFENANFWYVSTASARTAKMRALSGSAGSLRRWLRTYWWEARISGSNARLDDCSHLNLNRFVFMPLRNGNSKANAKFLAMQLVIETGSEKIPFRNHKCALSAHSIKANKVSRKDITQNITRAGLRPRSGGLKRR